jgi:putative ABC transport system permease protein
VGPAEVRVVCIDTTNVNIGRVLFLPLGTLRELTRTPEGAANRLWLTTTDDSHAAVDATALAVADRLRGAGFTTDVERSYVEQVQEQAANEAIVNVIRVMGLLIVAVGLIGLASALATGVLERTREIGVLRALGARRRHIRRILTAETLTLVLAGWLVGVPAGWLLSLGLRQMVLGAIDLEMPAVFPMANTGAVLVGLAVLAMAAVTPPRRRAGRLRPGEALRYQ